MNMIMNTERSDKQEIYWWSILDLHLKKKKNLFDHFDFKCCKSFITQND